MNSEANNAAGYLEQVRRLLELKGENPFKVRAYEKAAQAVAGRGDLLELAKSGRLTEIDGVGAGIAELLTEYLVESSTRLRDELAASLPPGLEELTQIPGVGIKKARQLIEELSVTNIGELERACRENRLLKLKGFGEKVQRKILDAISFHRVNADQRKLCEALPVAQRILHSLAEATEGRRVSETGPLRRRMETLSSMDFLVELPERGAKEFQGRIRSVVLPSLLPVRLHFAEPSRFGFELARTTGHPDHWEKLGRPEAFDASTEEAFFEKLGLPWIPPEMREGGDEIEMARRGELSKVLPWDGVRGIFHVHSTWSDGRASIEEMVAEAERLGFRYIGISDHSKTAFYAGGLTPDRLEQQEKEIRQVQERHPGIRIFRGIESDILADGALDYEPVILKRFDFVIASIHSRFKMDRQAMTDRVVAAIRNPYTRFLGHLTGRLLLGRPGYDLEMERVIQEAAAHDVAVEINAHPDRMDIDWRWGAALRDSGTKVSINPDAHEVAGLSDVQYGVTVARKALLPKRAVVNAGGIEEVERWLRRK